MDANVQFIVVNVWVKIYTTMYTGYLLKKIVYALLKKTRIISYIALRHIVCSLLFNCKPTLVSPLEISHQPVKLRKRL